MLSRNITFLSKAKSGTIQKQLNRLRFSTVVCDDEEFDNVRKEQGKKVMVSKTSVDSIHQRMFFNRKFMNDSSKCSISLHTGVLHARFSYFYLPN